MEDITIKLQNQVPLEFYKARYSKKYIKQEMELQKRVEENHKNFLKSEREKLIRDNKIPF